jgi:hypothetical protein
MFFLKNICKNKVFNKFCQKKYFELIFGGPLSIKRYFKRLFDSKSQIREGQP